jgi:hypothetical protein
MITEAQLQGGVTGLELCQRVSKERPDVQLVVTVATSDVGQDSVPSGARVLRKPYASGELRTLVAAKSLLADA